MEMEPSHMISQPLRTSFALPSPEDTTNYGSRCGSLQDTKSASALILNLPASRTMRNESVVYMPPSFFIIVYSSHKTEIKLVIHLCPLIVWGTDIFQEGYSYHRLEGQRQYRIMNISELAEPGWVEQQNRSVISHTGCMAGTQRCLENNSFYRYFQDILNILKGQSKQNH